MSGVCLAGALGIVLAVLPTQQFTLAWMHSVERIAWEEDYAIEGKRLRLVEARVRGTGAGMEPAEDAVFDGEVWRWRPMLPALERLRLTRSDFTADYRLCWEGHCRTLSTLLPPMREEGEMVDVYVCDPESITP